MSRSFKRENTLPTWEADRMNKQARKKVKQSRNASKSNREAQDALHKADHFDSEAQFYEMA